MDWGALPRQLRDACALTTFDHAVRSGAYRLESVPTLHRYRWRVCDRYERRNSLEYTVFFRQHNVPSRSMLVGYCLQSSLRALSRASASS